MFSNFQMIYNEKNDQLNIIKTNRDGKNIVKKEECKYGVEIHFDITNNPRCITIPEVSTLFGIPKENLVKFTSFFG